MWQYINLACSRISISPVNRASTFEEAKIALIMNEGTQSKIAVINNVAGPYLELWRWCWCGCSFLRLAFLCLGLLLVCNPQILDGFLKIWYHASNLHSWVIDLSSADEDVWGKDSEGDSGTEGVPTFYQRDSFRFSPADLQGFAWTRTVKGQVRKGKSQAITAQRYWK